MHVNNSYIRENAVFGIFGLDKDEQLTIDSQRVIKKFREN